MVFSSLTFLLLFLPAILAAILCLPQDLWRNAVLLTGSLIFYAWGEPVYVLAMLFVALAVYGGTLLVTSVKRPGTRKLLFALTIAVSLSALLYFKYAAFFVNQILPVFGSTKVLTTPRLPIGISFFTFQALTYAVDAYRGEVRVQKNFALLLLYVACFPQLIAGPIVQYSDIEYELRERQTTLDDFTSGMRRFAIGLGKKVLIANILGEMLVSLPSADASFTAAWLTSILFALQIYFDFSAYSDMAIGLGQVLGFRYQENFNYPYIARSVSEFWRRWHISLGRFFKEYVYIPLGGNRKGEARTTLNLLFVWALTGLWHGASWNFVLWGLYYGVFIALEHGVFRGAVKRIPRALGTALTLDRAVWMGAVLPDRSCALRAANARHVGTQQRFRQSDVHDTNGRGEFAGGKNLHDSAAGCLRTLRAGSAKTQAGVRPPPPRQKNGAACGNDPADAGRSTEYSEPSSGQL